MTRRTPRSTRTAMPFPYTTLFRSILGAIGQEGQRDRVVHRTGRIDLGRLRVGVTRAGEQRHHGHAARQSCAFPHDRMPFLAGPVADTISVAHEPLAVAVPGGAAWDAPRGLRAPLVLGHVFVAHRSS